MANFSHVSTNPLSSDFSPGSSSAPSSDGTLLITGASGFVGRALCAEILRRGLSVRAAVRKGRSGQVPASCAIAPIGDLSAETDWSDALRGVTTVVHLAARVHVMRENAQDPLAEFRKVNVAATANLARQAAGRGVRRLVFVSSIKVNGEATEGDRRYSEADAPAPLDAYGVSKWEAEQVLHRIAAETGLEIVVVRPPLVYGPGVKGNFAAMRCRWRPWITGAASSVSAISSMPCCVVRRIPRRRGRRIWSATARICPRPGCCAGSAMPWGFRRGCGPARRRCCVPARGFSGAARRWNACSVRCVSMAGRYGVNWAGSLPVRLPMA